MMSKEINKTCSLKLSTFSPICMLYAERKLCPKTNWSCCLKVERKLQPIFVDLFAVHISRETFCCSYVVLHTFSENCLTCQNIGIFLLHTLLCMVLLIPFLFPNMSRYSGSFTQIFDMEKTLFQSRQVDKITPNMVLLGWYVVLRIP